MCHQDTVPDKVENLIYAVRKGFRILHMLFRNTGTILNDLPAEFDNVIKTAG